MTTSAEEYLEKVRPIIENLAEAVITEKPEDPQGFMIEWLQCYSGSKNLSQMNMEKQELIQLRKEITKYQKKFAHQDQEMHLESGSEKESEDEIEDKDTVDELIQKNQLKNKSRARSSVSAEVYGQFNQIGKYTAKKVPKKEDQMKRLRTVVSKSFIFNNLDEKEVITVLDAVEEKKIKSGEVVITEGEKGDVLYIVEAGQLDCTKVLNKGANPTFLKVYSEGDSFGELALLYNAPRAATITAKSDCILWALDRETFNHIVKDAAMKQREKYEEFLKGMEILNGVNSYELSQICDALKSVWVDPGTYIIKELEDGDNFYIIAEGEAYAEKIPGIGKPPVKVKDYKTGDYFGELALLKNEPRAASIVAKTKVKLLSLDRKSFKRLLGPIEPILKRTESSYVKFIGN
jgi:cAMP-dependent protein kinase regulator